MGSRERIAGWNAGTGTGVGFFGLLAIVFITLKLLEKIDWSWWWVLAPLWFPFALFLVVFTFSIIGLLTLKAISKDK